MDDTATLTATSTGEHAPVRLVDLSVGGARVQTKLHVKPNELVSLSLRVAPGVELQLSARVVHMQYPDDATGAEFGLLFRSTQPADRRLLTQYISRLSIRIAAGAAAD